MKIRLQQKWKIIILSFILICSLGFNITSAIDGTVPEPGSDEDPIVSKSYVDMKVTELQSENALFKDEIALLKEQVQSGGSGGFQVVTLENGYIIFTGSGTEIVLRLGTAKAVKGENGGLSDTTAAKDLVDGTAVLANHLLISSRDDSRGIRAYSQCFLLVRGTYRVEQAPVEETISKPTETKTYGTVKASALNVREKPDMNAKILTKLVKGDVVEIIGKEGDWYKVTTASKITGWAFAAYITQK